MRKSTFLWLLLAVITGGILYHTSQQVTDGRAKLARLERASQREEESMRVLQAEWSYLNQPERLEKLANEYLKLAPMKGRQFTTISAIPAKDDGIPAANDGGIPAANDDGVPAADDGAEPALEKQGAQKDAEKQGGEKQGAVAKLAATEPAAGTPTAVIAPPAHVAAVKAVTATPPVAPKTAAVAKPAPLKANSITATRVTATPVKAAARPSHVIEKAATRRDFLDVMKSLEAAQ